MAKTKTTRNDALTTKGKFMVTLTLDDAELATKARKMAGLDEEIAALESQFDTVKSEWKSKISKKETDRRVVSQVVRDGTERRQVECTEVRDYAENTVSYVKDGKTLESRPMTADEHQLNMSLDKPKKTVTNGKHSDIGAVIQQETNKKTKRSSTDGATRI